MSGHRPTTGFWVIVVLVSLLLLYPISIGPACWITSRLDCGGDVIAILYRPVIRVWEASPNPFSNLVLWYTMAGADERYAWQMRVERRLVWGRRL